LPRGTIISKRADGRREAGSALLIVLTLTFLFSALAIGTSTVVQVEATVAGRFRDGAEALYVAEAGLALAAAELRGLGDWTPVLQGAIRSRLARGAFSGSAPVGGGTVLLCCTGDSVAGRLARESVASPVPARRALDWQPFLWASWDTLVPQARPPHLLLLVFTEDDEEDGDAEPGTDLNGVVMVRSEAIRPDGLRRAVEALIAREPGDAVREVPDRVRILRWREVR
jgi:hypothetical protein